MPSSVVESDRYYSFREGFPSYKGLFSLFVNRNPTPLDLGMFSGLPEYRNMRLFEVVCSPIPGQRVSEIPTNRRLQLHTFLQSCARRDGSRSIRTFHGPNRVLIFMAHIVNGRSDC